MTPFKQFLARHLKQVQWIVTIVCLLGATVVIAVGHFFFQDRPRLFIVFVVYISILTGVVIFFARYLIVIISERE